MKSSVFLFRILRQRSLAGKFFVYFRVLINDTHSCAFSKVNIGAQYEKYTCTCGLHIAVVLGSGTITNLTGNFLKGRIDIYCCCR